MPTGSPTRVVIADDSALMRTIVAVSLRKAGVKVVGSARDGDEALALCEREHPDAITLDLAMPGLDGLGVLRALRLRGGDSTPVVVVSAFSRAHGARAVDALAEGAFDLVPKPAVGAGLDHFTEDLITKVRLAAESRRVNGVGTAHVRREPRAAQRSAGPRAVVIATSTGGPRALATLLPQLPASIGIGTLIVQHMPPGFTASLAARLDRSSALGVREAAGGEILDPRTALIAPGGKHLRLSDEGRTVLSDEREIGGLRPRADLLIEDAARLYGERLLLVVLTGMGSDGLRGAEHVRLHGGRILVEARESCTVYGMPRAVAEADLADDVLGLDDLAEAITAEGRR
jgi:two-component system chemotaxis response regulator CheB